MASEVEREEAGGGAGSSRFPEEFTAASILSTVYDFCFRPKGRDDHAHGIREGNDWRKELIQDERKPDDSSPGRWNIAPGDVPRRVAFVTVLLFKKIVGYGASVQRSKCEGHRYKLFSSHAQAAPLWPPRLSVRPHWRAN